MPTNMETRVLQKTSLYDMLILKKDNQKVGTDVKGLDLLINRMEAAMEAEDVAWVEKKISQLK